MKLNVLKKCQNEWEEVLEKNRIRSVLSLTPNGREILKTYKLTNVYMEEPNIILFEIECMGYKQRFFMDEHSKTRKLDDSLTFGELLSVSDEEKKWLNELFFKLKSILEKYKEFLTDELIKKKTNKLLNKTIVDAKFQEGGFIELIFEDGTVLPISYGSITENGKFE